MGWTDKKKSAIRIDVVCLDETIKADDQSSKLIEDRRGVLEHFFNEKMVGLMTK